MPLRLPARARAWSLAALLGSLATSDALAGPPEPTQPAAADELVPPKLIAPVTFEYPQALLARDDPPGGRVTVRYVVGTDGVPKEIEVLESPDPELDALGLEVVARLRYEPATYQGEAVEVVLSLDFDVVPPVEPEPDEPEPDEPTTDEPATDEPDEPATGPVRIRGRLREAGPRTAIEGATLIAIPAGDLPLGPIKQTLYEAPSEPAWQVEARSDAEGRFALRGVPEGKVRLIVIAPGYERTEQVVELKVGSELEVNLWPRRLPTNPYSTVVVSEREAMPEVVERTISVEEIKQVPGSQGDALKAVLNFPGVARAPFGSGQLAIRGAAPEDSAIYFGYHEIPILYHFGGVRSVFASEILAQIDFIPGNFDSRYGDAIGGVVNVQPRKGRRDGFHGFVDTNLFDTGAMVEGPIAKKGSFIVAARRSYIDVILPRVIPADAGLNFAVAPRYWDYQALFDYPVSGGELSIRAFGSDDRTKLIFSDPNDDPDAVESARDGVETKQWFHRVDAVYRKQLGPWELLVTPAYRRSKTALSIFDILELDVVTDDVTGRAELSQQLTKSLRWRVGTELTITRFGIDVTAPQFTVGGSGPSANSALSRSVEATLFRGALYSTVTVALGERVTLFPGVRFEWYAAPLDRAALDPRLRAAFELGPTTTLKAATGLYTQGIQQPVQFDSSFGNPRLGLQRSFHNSLGVAQKLPWELSLELTGFYKQLWDLVVPSSLIVERQGGEIGPETFANLGTGRIYGLELLLRKQLTRSIFGWVSYTLSRSQRRLAPGEPFTLFDFDQTHILTIIASYKMPRGWQLGARFRLVSGNPTTPITDGVFDAASGSFTALQGPLNGDRLPAFHQLDLRLDKTWTWPILQFSVYVDVQNVYNRQNVEFLNFGYDFRATTTVNSLPILPALGFRLDF